MQFLPNTYFAVEASGETPLPAQSAAKRVAVPEKFDTVLSSFIDENRDDYSGRPAGFAAFGVESGTLSGETATRFAGVLRERNVPKDCVDRFERFVASGAPLTLGTAFKALAGKERATEALEGDDRTAFAALLGRFGMSRKEQDEMLELSDEGDGEAMWKRLSAALGKLEGPVELEAQDWKLLLKGLDASSKTENSLLAALPQGMDTLSFTGGRIQELLAGVKSDYASRSTALQYTRSQMLDAMRDVLNTRKNAENAAPIEDKRGTRRSEQAEVLMQNSVRKKTGVDALGENVVSEADTKGLFKAAIGRESAETKRENDEPDGRRGSKSRADRILAENPDVSKRENAGSENAADSLFSRISQRSETVSVPGAQSAQAPQTPQAAQVPGAQNLTQLATQHRQEIFSQVETGILQNMHNGMQRLTLQLKPADLGQLTIVLSMQQGELKATIRADRPESAEALRGQLVELRQTLEAQGIKVKELDVQTGLSDNAFAGNWDGHDEHNRMRDAGERERVLRLARIRREGVSLADGEMETQARATVEAGLHIVA